MKEENKEKLLTPKEINAALKALKYDHERLEAMEDICKCGAITYDKSICWACFDSGDYD